MELSDYRVKKTLLSNEGIKDRLIELRDLMKTYEKLTGKCHVDSNEGREHYHILINHEYSVRFHLSFTTNANRRWGRAKMFRLTATLEGNTNWVNIFSVDREILFELGTFRRIMEDAIEKAEDEAFILKAEAEAIAEVI